MASCDLSFFFLSSSLLHSLTFEKKKLLVTFAAFVVIFYALGSNGECSWAHREHWNFPVLWIAGGKKQITSNIKRLNGICGLRGPRAAGAWFGGAHPAEKSKETNDAAYL